MSLRFYTSALSPLSLKSHLQNSGAQQNRPFEALCAPAVLAKHLKIIDFSGHWNFASGSKAFNYTPEKHKVNLKSINTSSILDLKKKFFR